MHSYPKLPCWVTVAVRSPPSKYESPYGVVTKLESMTRSKFGSACLANVVDSERPILVSFADIKDFGEHKCKDDTEWTDAGGPRNGLREPKRPVRES